MQNISEVESKYLDQIEICEFSPTEERSDSYPKLPIEKELSVDSSENDQFQADLKEFKNFRISEKSKKN